MNRKTSKRETPAVVNTQTSLQRRTHERKETLDSFIAVRCPRWLSRAMRVLAAEKGVSLQTLVHEALVAHYQLRAPKQGEGANG